jgi:hypothetical protein
VTESRSRSRTQGVGRSFARPKRMQTVAVKPQVAVRVVRRRGVVRGVALVISRNNNYSYRKSLIIITILFYFIFLYIYIFLIINIIIHNK